MDKKGIKEKKMINKPIKLSKNFDHYTFTEKRWIMRKHRFIRAEFHDRKGTIRSYYSINLNTMTSDDPPGFTIGQKRYNIDMEHSWVDATNKVTYLRYTMGIPDPDGWGSIEVIKTDPETHIQTHERIHDMPMRIMDDTTFYTRMLRHQAHNMLTRGEDEEKLIKYVTILLILSVINILVTFMGLGG